MSSFEGSYLGDASRIDAASRMECGVCWWVYDPAEGDSHWQIAAGTAFAELPTHWRCPRCDAAPSQFMVTDGGTRRETGEDNDGQSAPVQQAMEQRLLSAYQSAATRMQNLPVYNPALQVEVVGSRDCEHGRITVVLTPWMMNLTLTNPEASSRREGTSRNLQFPSGTYPFTAAYLDGVGALETCSLFSPMACFDDQDVARSVGRQALAALFVAGQPPEQTADSTPPERRSAEPVSRRQLLRGRVGSVS